MSKQDYTAVSGPGWVDVKKAIDHIEHTFMGKITVTIELHHKKGAEPYIFVNSAFRTAGEYPNGVIRTAASTKWTDREFKTVTAIIYSQALRIDNWLTKEQENAERQAHF